MQPPSIASQANCPQLTAWPVSPPQVDWPWPVQLTSHVHELPQLMFCVHELKPEHSTVHGPSPQNTLRHAPAPLHLIEHDAASVQSICERQSLLRPQPISQFQPGGHAMPCVQSAAPG